MVVTRPGTTLQRRLGPESEIWQPIWQSVVGIVALDTVLTCILLCCMVAGWWSFGVFLSVVGFLIGMVIIVFGRPSGWLARVIVGNLWGIGGVVGLAVGQQWHGALTTGLQLIWSQLATITQLPVWVYPVVAFTLAVIWIKTNWKAMIAVALIAAVTGIILLSDDGAWLKAWQLLKWLLIPYSWPVIGFGLLLSLSMAINVLFPSLEWTMNPVNLEELREVGLIGLLAPGLFGKSEDKPEVRPELTVRAEHRSNGNGGLAQEEYARLPFSESARDFYKALHAGRPFSLSEARRSGVYRRTFEGKIWPAFRERGWARWKNEEHHDQGRELTQAGIEMVEELALNDPRG